MYNIEQKKGRNKKSISLWWEIDEWQTFFLLFSTALHSREEICLWILNVNATNAFLEFEFEFHIKCRWIRASFKEKIHKNKSNVLNTKIIIFHSLVWLLYKHATINIESYFISTTFLFLVESAVAKIIDDENIIIF
jgi:hypothetical protein